MPIQNMEGLKHKTIPVIFLIDTSGSMDGLGITQVNINLKEYIEDLKTDPQTKEAVQVTIVTFNSSASIIKNFEPIAMLVPPVLTADATTDLALGLCKLMEVIQEKSDYIRANCKRPLLIFMSDGNPDPGCKWKPELDNMNADYIMKRAVRVALGAGNNINDSTLEAFILNKETDRAVKVADVQDLREFFKYLQTITREMISNKPLSTPLQAGVDSVELVNP